VPPEAKYVVKFTLLYEHSVGNMSHVELVPVVAPVPSSESLPEYVLLRYVI
jgi:hypothetical protein